MVRACRLDGDHLSVCLSVRRVYYGKTADWIRIPFRVVSGVGRGMGVLDGLVIVEGERADFGVNLGRPIVTNGAFEEMREPIELSFGVVSGVGSGIDV